MVILHISDLHFGKILQNKSMVDDQRAWAKRFVALVRSEAPAAVVVAGDVYDRAAPSAEAVELLDEFLTDLLSIDSGPAVMVVAGNHDSGPRLAFGAEILKRQRLHLAGATKRRMETVVLEDEHGPVTFWLMPYTFPAAIQQALRDEGEDDAPRTYTEAVRHYLEAQDIDFAGRNVLVAHQSVTWAGREAEQGGSETMIGGVGGIDGTVFDGFDYVALGHIHKAQEIGRPTMRYAGSPLCYHFDEARWPEKGAVRVELGAKGDVSARLVPIEPLHPLRVVEGAYDEIIASETANPARGEYVKVVLTDRRVDQASGDALRALFLSKGSIALETGSAYHPFSAPGGTGAAHRAERALEECFTAFWRDRHGGSDPDAATAALVRRAAEQVESGRPMSGGDVDELVRLAMGTGEDTP